MVLLLAETIIGLYDDFGQLDMCSAKVNNCCAVVTFVKVSLKLAWEVISWHFRAALAQYFSRWLKNISFLLVEFGWLGKISPPHFYESCKAGNGIFWCPPKISRYCDGKKILWKLFWILWQHWIYFASILMCRSKIYTKWNHGLYLRHTE